MKKKKNTISLRRAKKAFRFDKNRDDHNLKGLTAYVFAQRSPLLDPHNQNHTGVFGAPMVVLQDYTRTTTENGLFSVALAPAYILGRLVEVTMPELARLDQVMELVGNYHRFRADVKSPQTGYTFEAWVYQDLDDATPLEMATSAIESDLQSQLQSR